MDRTLKTKYCKHYSLIPNPQFSIRAVQALVGQQALEGFAVALQRRQAPACGETPGLRLVNIRRKPHKLALTIPQNNEIN